MLLAADFLLYIVRWCSIIASHSTKSNIKIVIAGIFFIFLFLYLFSKILFWTETGSFHRTITKTDAVEFVIECDPFDVLAVAKELEPYAKKYTDVEVELKYIEYSFKGNEITAMYGTEREEEKPFNSIWILTNTLYMKYPNLQQVEKNLAVFQASISMPTSTLWMNTKRSKTAIRILIR